MPTQPATQGSGLPIQKWMEGATDLITHVYLLLVGLEKPGRRIQR